MNRPSLSHRLILGTVAVGSIACGGNGAPGREQIEQALRSPSGRVSDGTGVRNIWNTQGIQRELISEDLIGSFPFFGGGSSFLDGEDLGDLPSPESAGSKIDLWGAGLQADAPLAHRVQQVFGAIRGWGQQHTRSLVGSGIALQHQGLAASEFVVESAGLDCARTEGSEPSVSGHRAKASGTIDLSGCGAQGLSGKLKLDLEAEADVDRREYSLDVEVRFEAFCVTEENTACLDGIFYTEFSAKENGTTISLTVGDDDFDSEAVPNIDFELIQGWDLLLTVEGIAGFPAEGIALKGGLLFAATTGESLELKIASFVPDQAGDEVSYVLSFEADAHEATIAVEGQDGRIECAADGEAVVCTGDSSHRFEPSFRQP